MSRIICIVDRGWFLLAQPGVYFLCYSLLTAYGSIIWMLDQEQEGCNFTFWRHCNLRTKSLSAYTKCVSRTSQELLPLATVISFCLLPFFKLKTDKPAREWAIQLKIEHYLTKIFLLCYYFERILGIFLLLLYFSMCVDLRFVRSVSFSLNNSVACCSIPSPLPSFQNVALWTLSYLPIAQQYDFDVGACSNKNKMFWKLVSSIKLIFRPCSNPGFND